MSDFNNDGNENDMDTELEENGQADSIPEPSQEEIARYEDPHYPEYYLRQIPTTEAEILTSNEIIQEGLYNMGIILRTTLKTTLQRQSNLTGYRHSIQTMYTGLTSTTTCT